MRFFLRFRPTFYASAMRLRRSSLGSKSKSEKGSLAVENKGSPPMHRKAKPENSRWPWTRRVPTPCIVGFGVYGHRFSAPAGTGCIGITKANWTSGRWPWTRRAPLYVPPMGRTRHTSAHSATQKGELQSINCTSSDKLAKTNTLRGIVWATLPSGVHTKPYLAPRYGFS